MDVSQEEAADSVNQACNYYVAIGVIKVYY